MDTEVIRQQREAYLRNLSGEHTGGSSRPSPSGESSQTSQSNTSTNERSKPKNQREERQDKIQESMQGSQKESKQTTDVERKAEKVSNLGRKDLTGEVKPVKKLVERKVNPEVIREQREAYLQNLSSTQPKNSSTSLSETNTRTEQSNERSALTLQTENNPEEIPEPTQGNTASRKKAKLKEEKQTEEFTEDDYVQMLSSVLDVEVVSRMNLYK